jgi:hypothetical protein
MKQQLTDLLIKKGFFINKSTNAQTLVNFFKLIRPKKTNFELIRFGGESDGGYLIPDDLEGVKNCFSPGVSLESFFEDELSKLGIKSYMADYSVERPEIENDRFDFIKKYIGFDHNENFITLENWIESKENFDNEMLLQMDIEGAEYDVIFDTSNEILAKFRIIVIEFHDFHRILNPYAFPFIESCFIKLLKNFHIVHIHPNNNGEIIRSNEFEIPSLMEFTFLRKDRVSSFSYETNFPNKLDKKNVLHKVEMKLPTCFYK